eukprot:UN19329
MSTMFVFVPNLVVRNRGVFTAFGNASHVHSFGPIQG